MGYARAADMIVFAGVDTALRDHLQHNLFPPRHDLVRFADELVAAAKACGEDDWDREVTLGGHPIQASVLVTTLRLDSFVDYFAGIPDGDA